MGASVGWPGMSAGCRGAGATSLGTIILSSSFTATSRVGCDEGVEVDLHASGCDRSSEGSCPRARWAWLQVAEVHGCKCLLSCSTAAFSCQRSLQAQLGRDGTRATKRFWLCLDMPDLTGRSSKVVREVCLS